jgi:hypothetical protein
MRRQLTERLVESRWYVMDLTGGRAAAQRMANAVPAVAEAPPGLHTPLTLPAVTGRRLLR